MASREHHPTRYRARSAAYSDTERRSERTASVGQQSSGVSAFEYLQDTDVVSSRAAEYAGLATLS